MDKDYLKAQADRCRGLAEMADPLTKKRLLDLADAYDRRAGKPSAAVRALKATSNPGVPKTR